MHKYQSLIDTFGRDHVDRVQSSRVLVVGAGGIGCEILKNLVLSGFLNIEVIDLDTIDVSNLNRQFLFRTEHVGQSKAVVAAAAARAFNPDVSIVAHRGNVKDAQFGIDYISKFNVVLNALDNVDARRHVNRLCLATKVPLLDSGTTGYLGQCMPIFKGRTACYECRPKEAQKVYPICTIRSTPDQPVHCVVWAKECFKLLFGNKSESMLYESPTSLEESTYMGLIPFPDGIQDDIDQFVKHCSALLTAFYITEVTKRIDMGIYKTAKIAPKILDATCIELGAITAGAMIKRNPKSNQSASAADWDRVVWNDEASAVVIILCMWEAMLCPDMIGKIPFDKDDSMAMRFVCAASNMRSNVFGIKPMTYHDSKGMAGNIIPAIATTNAIVAGVQVLQAFRILKGQTLVSSLPSDLSDDARANTELFLNVTPHTYCLRSPTRSGRYLDPTYPDNPVASCYVCSLQQLTLQIDTTVSTLQDLLRLVVKGRLSFNAPTIMIGSSELYEEGENADEDLKNNLPLTLAQCPAGGLVCGTVVTVEDYTQELTVRILVRHVSSEVLMSSRSEKDPAVDSPGELFVLDGLDDFRRKQIAEEKEALASGIKNPESSDLEVYNDDFIILETEEKEDPECDVVEVLPNREKKRPRDETEEIQNSNKR